MLKDLSTPCLIVDRGKLDNNEKLISFCKTLEEVCIETVEDGKMTKDLALLVFRDDLVNSNFLTTHEFLDELKSNLDKKLAI